MLLVLLGAPGAGKGTQADILTEQRGFTHLSSGDLLREHRANKTELGQLAQSYMDRGDLVPDDVIIRMVLGRLDQETNGSDVVLDGFPRTAPQAEALDKALGGNGIDRVLHVMVPEDELVRRLSGRYSCRSCQRPYTSEAARVRFVPRVRRRALPAGGRQAGGGAQSAAGVLRPDLAPDRLLPGAGEAGRCERPAGRGRRHVGGAAGAGGLAARALLVQNTRRICTMAFRAFGGDCVRGITGSRTASVH